MKKEGKNVLPYRDEVQISAVIRRRLKSEIRRTGVTALKLFKDDPELPEGLTPGRVNRWAGGLVKEVQAEHLNYVLSRYGSLPDKASERSAQWMKYTADMAGRFRAELNRTGKTPKSLLHGVSDIPAALSVRSLESWYRRKARFVRTDHWELVFSHLASLPEKSAPPGKRRYLSPPRNPPISDDALAQLRHYRERTGIGGNILLRLSSGKPAGLTEGMISGWLNGTTKSAAPAHIEFVLSAYRRFLRE